MRKFSSQYGWNYVQTNHNPVDLGTRFVPAHVIQISGWLLGPRLRLSSEQKENSIEEYQLIYLGDDWEIRARFNVAKTYAKPECKGIGTDRYH